MSNKTEEYLALAQRTANGLTRYWESWTDYLTTASRLYKYPFADQLMIYAQRPDATACADYDVWNNRMNRYVRRGSKGIALLDESSGFPRLHYVFDVSDTGVRRNSRDPEVWQYNDDLKQPVSQMGDSIKAAEARLTEIAVLKTHIINYAKTREVYAAYRKAGYSKAFLEAHREEITLHKAAKAAFDEAGLQKLPKVKELDAEFAELLTKKKAAYPDYRTARNEMQELVRAQKNVERFFAGEKDTIEKAQTR